MIRAALTFAVAMLVALPAWAQRAQPLRGADDAKHFCAHSEPRAGEGEGEADEAYDARRRAVAQRPLEVLLTAAAAPVIGYERVTGSLDVSLYRPARFTADYAVASNVGSVGFELPEEAAQRLWARYESGAASLKITFLPLAWSDYERHLCRTEGDTHVIDGELLVVDFVDEVGKSLARHQTQLGREVALMRQHRVNGYLDNGIPVVTVSALTSYPAREDAPTLPDEASVRSQMRAALYGCYLRALSSNARMQGALVVKLTPSERAASILVDSLHDDDMGACALERLQEVVGRASHAGSIKVTVIFRLEEAASL